MLSVVLVAQVLAALGVIILVLLQHGKGADMGAAFGSGSSGSLFGATGSANFLSRLTGGLAAVFFICTLILSFMSQTRPSGGGSVMDQPVTTDGAKTDASKSDVPKADAPKGDVPKDSAKDMVKDAVKDAPPSDAAKPEAAKSEPNKDAAKPDAAKPNQGSEIPK